MLFPQALCKFVRIIEIPQKYSGTEIMKRITIDPFGSKITSKNLERGSKITTFL